MSAPDNQVMLVVLGLSGATHSCHFGTPRSSTSAVMGHWDAMLGCGGYNIQMWTRFPLCDFVEVPFSL